MNPDAIGGALGLQAGSHEAAFGARAAVCEGKAVDLAFVADQIARLDADSTSRFAGRLDTNRVGGIGHSSAGTPRWSGVALIRVVRRRQPRRSDLDRGRQGRTRASGPAGVGRARRVRRVTRRGGDDGDAPSAEWFEVEKEITFGGWRTIHSHARPGYTVRIVGATHMSFMDVPFLPLIDGAAVEAMLAATTIDARRMWRITSDLVLAFFAKHFDGTPTALLDGNPQHPEAVFGPA